MAERTGLGQEGFKRRVVEEIATRLYAAEELARTAERDYARRDIHRAYWRMRRDQAESSRIVLWAVARELGQDIDRAVDVELKKLRLLGAHQREERTDG